MSTNLEVRLYVVEGLVIFHEAWQYGCLAEDKWCHSFTAAVDVSRSHLIVAPQMLACNLAMQTIGSLPEVSHTWLYRDFPTPLSFLDVFCLAFLSRCTRCGGTSGKDHQMEGQ